MAAVVGGWVPSLSSISWYSYSKNPGILIRNAAANSKRNEPSKSPTVPKKKSKPRLITISTSDGRWHGKWDSDYVFSLRDVGLNELPDGAERERVHVTLCIEKHAGLGLSVEGRIRTSFTARCCNCYSPFIRQIDAPFKVWILASTRQSRDNGNQIPIIGDDDQDPSVILVKPGYEADLDPVIQDTTRLAISVNETCSESCDKSEPRLQNLGATNAASFDRRWSKLLELKNKGSNTRR